MWGWAQERYGLAVRGYHAWVPNRGTTADAYRSDCKIVTPTLDWDRAKFHAIDDRTRRLEVPLLQELEEDAWTALAAAVVGLEVVGGPIEDAKLSRSHIRMEITRDADLEAIKQRLQALVDGVLSPTD